MWSTVTQTAILRERKERIIHIHIYYIGQLPNIRCTVAQVNHGNEVSSFLFLTDLMGSDNRVAMLRAAGAAGTSSTQFRGFSTPSPLSTPLPYSTDFQNFKLNSN